MTLALPFYIPRREMPQIEDISDCVGWLEQRGITARLVRNVSPTLFRTHQRVWIDPERAKRIPIAALQNPLLVASDGFVIDGNHRLALACEKGERVAGCIISEPFGAALVTLQYYPHLKHSEGEP